MRQAYDYWQDQPGNYHSVRPSGPKTSPQRSLPEEGVGVSSTQIDRRHVKSSRGTHPSISAPTVLPRSPAMPSTLFPRSHMPLGELLPLPTRDGGWLPSKKTASNQKTGHVLLRSQRIFEIINSIGSGHRRSTHFPSSQHARRPRRVLV